MGTSDPKEIIRNTLEAANASNWPFASLSLETIQFLKSRYDPIYQVHYVTVQDTTGQRWCFTFFLSKEADQWHVKTHDGSPESVFNKPVEQHDQPWIRLETLVMLNEFIAFGEVFDKGKQIVRVGLRDSGSLVLEDTVKNGIVLFQANHQPTFPLQMELHGGSGSIIRRQTVAL